jgi:formylglycine-generating enzyme required for sulfatase activity
VYGKSAAISSLVLGRIVESLVSEIEADPAMLAAFAASAPMELRKKFEQSDYYSKNLATLKHNRESVTQAVRGAQLSVAGMSFVGFGPGTAVVNANPALPALVELGSFHIAASETTIAEFKRFIAANPSWSRESRAALEKDGLVESDYLLDIDSASDSRPIRYVSKPAAEAYCEWLSTYAPTGYRITLPTEAQWSYVASAAGSSASQSAILQENGRDGPVPLSSIQADSAGMRGLLGNVWEWCADPYAIQPASGMEGRKSYTYSEYVVRGACWANRADLVSLDSRGPMPSATCSAYLGFRVVLVLESE